MTVMNEIETGYKISGRTWISDAWNAGELTRDQIRDTIAEYGSHETEDEIRAKLLESEAEHARELFEQDGNTTPYETLLDECVEREMEYDCNEQDAKNHVAEALQELYDDWNDDVEDDERYELVLAAHFALDTYCRKSQQGDFYFP
jgi:hypothetical protein